ncbi:MAG: toprim domain-containing protein [Gammaproteobacteria bacterium]|nr:toprim domain-containing protein [Gammaproteobacteria bacterium]
MTYPTFTQIIDGLQSRPQQVAERYAPGGRVSGGRYWACCPWRNDTTPNSFHVSLHGSYAGRYRDEATGDMGDMLDLIQQACNLDRRGALEEAKAFLGMAGETPQQQRLRDRQTKKAKQNQEQATRDAHKKSVMRRKQAQAIYLSNRGDWAGSPVDHYLAGRAITLAAMGRQPNTICFAPKLKYYQTDKTTGEIFEGAYPAMVAAIYGAAVDGQRPEFMGIHQTFLSQLTDGRWVKADHPDLPDDVRLPRAKILMGSKKGGFIRLWTGIGPRGGKGAPLSRGAGVVWITEGIEDGLSAVCLDPTRRVLAGIDLGNLRSMILPKTIDRIILIGDNDKDPKLLAALDVARARFADRHGTCIIWRSPHGHDLNDALVKFSKNEGVSDAR